MLTRSAQTNEEAVDPLTLVSRSCYNLSYNLDCKRGDAGSQRAQHLPFVAIMIASRYSYRLDSSNYYRKP